jgi:hypothetical protein
MTKSDITSQKFTLVVDPDRGLLGSYVMYVSLEELSRNTRVINGVYIRREYLTNPPPARLVVSFEE